MSYMGHGTTEAQLHIVCSKNTEKNLKKSNIYYYISSKPEGTPMYAFEASVLHTFTQNEEK